MAKKKVSQTAKANEYQAERSKDCQKKVEKAIIEMNTYSLPLSVSSISTYSGVSKSFIYKNEYVMNMIGSYKQVTAKRTPDLDRINQLKAEVKKQTLINNKLNSEIVAAKSINYKALENDIEHKKNLLKIYEAYQRQKNKEKYGF